MVSFGGVECWKGLVSPKKGTGWFLYGFIGLEMTETWRIAE